MTAASRPTIDLLERLCVLAAAEAGHIDRIDDEALTALCAERAELLAALPPAGDYPPDARPLIERLLALTTANAGAAATEAARLRREILGVDQGRRAVSAYASGPPRRGAPGSEATGSIERSG